MSQGWNGWYWNLGLASLRAIGGALALGGGFLCPITEFGDCAKAQIAPDGTLGAENSVITPLAPGSTVDVISGGATRGANLFHSFDQFSVLIGREAHFNNTLDIQNIISRVTGSSVSNINGLLQANGTANLFLLNPNGIIFGPNASLNVGGSFVTTSANAIEFGNQGVFSASAPNVPPVLTVNPSAFLFNQISNGSIENNSIALAGLSPSGSNVRGLRVPDGRSLLLVGGDIRLENGGILNALGGRVELGGLAGVGTVGLGINGNTFNLSFTPDSLLSNVTLADDAQVNVRSSGGGNIVVNANTFTATNGGRLVAGIAQGPQRLGNAGDITVNANNFSISGVGSSGSESGLYNETRTNASGNAGNIFINTRLFNASSGAMIISSTSGKGDAGSVTITASDTASFDGVEVDGNEQSSGVFSRVHRGAIGKGGDINITTGSLSVSNGAYLSNETAGEGDAGNVAIHVGSTASFDGVGSNGRSSTILSRVGLGGIGKGGDINITTGSLSMSNGAYLAASNTVGGDAGNVTIHARSTVSFDGVEVDGDKQSSGAFSTVQSETKGKGGDINITTGSLSVSNGAYLTTETRGNGDAGNVTIHAGSTVSFDGVGSNGQRSGVFSNVSRRRAMGKGGSIDITAGLLSITNGAQLSAGSAGSGAAGNIEVAARSIYLDNQGKLSAETALGSGGNIILKDLDLLLLRNNSEISTTAGTAGAGGNGGDITIDTDLFVLEDSYIKADAFEGQGGNVQINTQGLFLSRNSQITASSERGIDGVVEINTLGIDPSNGLVALPVQLVDASGLIASACGTPGGQDQSEFIITGRGGLPSNPSEPLSSDTVWSDLRTSTKLTENLPSSAVTTQPTSSKAEQLVEAQGWMINDKGEVVLTATAPSVTLYIPWMRSLTCHTP